MNYSNSYEDKKADDMVAIFFILASLVGFALTVSAVEHANPAQTEKAFIILYTILIIQLAIYIITKQMQMRRDVIVIIDTMLLIFLFLFKMKRTKHLRK